MPLVINGYTILKPERLVTIDYALLCHFLQQKEEQKEKQRKEGEAKAAEAQQQDNAEASGAGSSKGSTQRSQ
jgi:hypothetical protein